MKLWRPGHAGLFFCESSPMGLSGINPAVTKKLMGHKNEDMSLIAYANASDEDAFDAMMSRKYKQ